MQNLKHRKMPVQQVWISPGKDQKEISDKIRKAIGKLPENCSREFVSKPDESIMFQYSGTMLDSVKMMNLGASMTQQFT